jgi:hypothetical protein
MRDDAHQGDRQQRAANAQQSCSRRSLAPDEAGHHRNGSRCDPSDGSNDRHGAGRKSTIEQHQTDEARHPCHGAPGKANRRHGDVRRDQIDRK